MDYEHLYRYLNTRPIEEVKDCMFNVIKLVKKREPERVPKEQHRIAHLPKTDSKTVDSLRIAQRVWTEQAVWSTFGAVSPVTFSSSQALAEATASLMQQGSTQHFITTVCTLIENECKGDNCSHLIKSSVPSGTSVASGSVASPITEADCDHESAQYSDAHSDRSHNSPSSEYESLDENRSSSSIDDNHVVLDEPYAPLNPNKRKRAYKPRQRWTEDMDDALLVAIAEHKKEGWEAVGKAMNKGASKDQCVLRWHCRLKHQQKGMQAKSNFTSAEIHQLRALVKEHTHVVHRAISTGTGIRTTVSWKKVGMALGVLPQCCSNQWSAMKK